MGLSPAQSSALICRRLARELSAKSAQARARSGLIGLCLVRLHELVDDMDVFSLLPANQDVAFANMSRSC